MRADYQNLWLTAAFSPFPLLAADDTEKPIIPHHCNFGGKDKSGVVLQLRLLWQHRGGHLVDGGESADSSLVASLRCLSREQGPDRKTQPSPRGFSSTPTPQTHTPFQELLFTHWKPLEKKPRIPMAWTLMQGLPRRRATGAHSPSLHPTQLHHRHRPAAEVALPQRDQRPPSQSRRHEA